MRTKWQSSHVFGDNTFVSVMGNHKLGNEFVDIREILLDLSRKVYYISSQLFLFKEILWKRKL